MDREASIRYMKDHMNNNKAMGLLAQAEFEKWARENQSVKPKYFDGCWILSPKGYTASRRFCFMIHGKLEKKERIAEIIKNILLKRGYHALFGSISRTGLGVTYCIPTGDDDTDFENINWKLFRYQDENLTEINSYAFFNGWPGNRGRASTGREWDAIVAERYETLDLKLLDSLVLNQVFYNSFIKGVFKKPLDDPYDTDSFIVSYEGKIFPVEIKEKFPFTTGKNKKFGIDAGRILMLLRICLPLDCNGLYVIREVTKENRKFVGWKMMTLDSMIMNSNWNLQAGGTGMRGGSTQTVTFPYEVFSDMDNGSFSDNKLHEMSKFSDRVKEKAKDFFDEAAKLFSQSKQQSSLG